MTNRMALARLSSPMAAQGIGVVHPAAVILEGDIQALVQSVLDAPGLPVGA